MCKEYDGEVSIKSSSYYLITSTEAPYQGSKALNNRCCLPEKGFDITKLVCKDPLEGGFCPRNSIIIVDQTQQNLDNLACLCCEGKVKVVTSGGDSSKAKVICNADGGFASGTCGN